MGDGIYQIQLNSRDGSELSKAGNRNYITWSLGKGIPLRKGSARCSIALLGGFIPRSIPMISELNCAWTVTIDGTPYVCEIEHGNYDARTLATAVQTSINTVSGLSFVITYSTITNKFKFVVADAGYSTITLSFDDSHTTYEILGFSKNVQEFSENGGWWTIYSDNVVNVSSVPSVDILLEGAGFDDSLTPKGTSNILHRVYFRGGFNSIETLAVPFIDWKSVIYSSAEITSITIRIVDTRGRDVSFSGLDWELTLLVKKT